MKKFIILCLSVFFIQATVKAGDKVVVQFTDLPAKAQQTINTSFDKSKIALIKKELGFLNSYDVIFSNGDEIEFNNGGEWKDIDCKYTSIPNTLIPPTINKYVTTNYPNTKIIKMEKDRSNIEVELANGLELTFDSNYNLIDIDN